MYKSFNSFTGNKLYAVKEKWYNSCLLLQDETDTYGKLHYSGTFKTKVSIEIEGQSWNIEEKGFWHGYIEITDNTTGVVLIFKKNWSGCKGVLFMPDGRELRYTNTGFWSSDYTWNDPQRGEVIRISTKTFSKRSVEIEVMDSVKANPILPLLAFLGIYCVESARSAAAVSAGV